MGVHPGGPSKTKVQDKIIPLSELTELPFLLKFLAAESPLSIQAHPNITQAQEGFERENRAGLPAAERNYQDPNHKPEIVCALTPFTAMAGFRETTETDRLLSLVNGTEGLRSFLKEGYRSFLSALFDLNKEERKALTLSILQTVETVVAAGPAADKNSPAALIRLCGEFAKTYPNDPGILSPLYLNVIELEPFEGIFIPAGILHAYVRGFALECMANSDNVLRGGLTPKHIDLKELFSILNFEPFKPELLKPVPRSPGCYSYAPAALCREFTLYLLKGTKVELTVPEKGIAAVFEGAASVAVAETRTADIEAAKKQNGGQKVFLLNRGESAFIGRRQGEERLIFSGSDTFTLFAALAQE
jgi:mannose-6-phosphate isomerase